jgi:hypothetical protein
MCLFTSSNLDDSKKFFSHRFKVYIKKSLASKMRIKSKNQIGFYRTNNKKPSFYYKSIDFKGNFCLRLVKVK